jgi:TRAP transporter TAXI family solute receptor
MAGAYPEVCQIVAAEGITDISQLAGKRVSVGDAGSGTEFNAKQVLAAYDISFDDITVENLDFGNSATALKDGKIDAFFVMAGAPTTNIVDLCTTTKISLLSLDDEHIAKLQENYSFYTAYTVAAGTYTGVDADVQTVAVKATFLVSDSLSDDVVYAMTKTLFECADQMDHEKAAFLDPTYAVEGFKDFPIHPGALKYYQEIGVLN